MGQVGMGLIWEHIYESCMTYLWAKWAWFDLEHIYGVCMAYLCAKFGLNWETQCRDPRSAGPGGVVVGGLSWG